MIDPPGTLVWLHSLSSDRLNGKTALSVRVADPNRDEAAARGRCAVLLLGDASVVFVRPCNISLSPLEFICIKESAGTGGLGVYARVGQPDRPTL